MTKQISFLLSKEKEIGLPPPQKACKLLNFDLSQYFNGNNPQFDTLIWYHRTLFDFFLLIYLFIFLGFHVRLLLSTILDWSSTCFWKETWCRNSLCGFRVYKKHLGSWYIFCEWKAIVLPQRYHKQWVYSGSSLRQYYQEYKVIIRWIVINRL